MGSSGLVERTCLAIHDERSVARQLMTIFPCFKVRPRLIEEHPAPRLLDRVLVHDGERHARLSLVLAEAIQDPFSGFLVSNHVRLTLVIQTWVIPKSLFVAASKAALGFGPARAGSIG